MIQGFAQTPFVWHLSQAQGGPGKMHTVPPPAETPPAWLSVPAAAPASAPKATSAPRPKKLRRLVFRASLSLTRCSSDIDLIPSVLYALGQLAGLVWKSLPQPQLGVGELP